MQDELARQSETLAQLEALIAVTQEELASLESSVSATDKVVF